MSGQVNHFSKAFIWILMGLLIVGLAGFGAVNFTGTARTIGIAGDTEITIDDYARELQREIRAIEAQTGQTLQMNQTLEMGLDRTALARLVALASLDDEVANLGLSVGDENLQREIVEIAAFHDINGQFDRETYRFALNQQGISEAEFEADLRAEAARTLVQGAIIGGIEMPAIMTDTLMTYIGARRDFTWAPVTAEMLDAPVGSPTEADIAAYYEANTDAFTLPETKRLTYVLLTPEMLLDEVEVDEAALRTRYKELEDRFNTPERRLVERLVFADQEAAASAMAQLEVNGTTFEALVADRGLDLSDVDMGDVTRADLGAAAEAVFAAEPGAVVGPLATDLGPALFRVNGVLAEQVTTFEEAAPELRDELAADRARRLIETRSQDIDDLLAGGATLEDLAAETDMELGQIDWTAASFEGVAAYSEFREAAEQVTEDDFPAVAFLEDGGIFALRLEEVLPPRPEPLDQARDRVAAAWTAAQTQAALEARAEELAAELASGRSFEDLGLVASTESGLTRSAFVEGTPRDFMARVFEMDEGAVEVIAGDGVVTLARLDAALPPEESPDMARLRDAIAQELNQALAQELFDLYVRDAQLRARPQIDQQTINAVHANFR